MTQLSDESENVVETDATSANSRKVPLDKYEMNERQESPDDVRCSNNRFVSDVCRDAFFKLRANIFDGMSKIPLEYSS
jgi:hypothetical protein